MVKDGLTVGYLRMDERTSCARAIHICRGEFERPRRRLDHSRCAEAPIGATASPLNVTILCADTDLESFRPQQLPKRTPKGNSVPDPSLDELPVSTTRSNCPRCEPTMSFPRKFPADQLSTSQPSIARQQLASTVLQNGAGLAPRFEATGSQPARARALLMNSHSGMLSAGLVMPRCTSPLV